MQVWLSKDDYLKEVTNDISRSSEEMRKEQKKSQYM